MDNNLQQVLTNLKDSFPGAQIRINGRQDIDEHRLADCYDRHHLKVEIESAVFCELTILEQHH
ncbi:MAG: hypothetical protein ABIA75_12115 [Candidatus Neomarinimicrobiota bacterium]